MNKGCSKDKVVVDVGTGTGVLSIWAAKAGARKAYAIEVTETAEHAPKCVAAGGVGGVVEVLQQRVGDVVLPEGPNSVDTTVSEWMRYFLIRGSMLDSTLVARDRWLKRGVPCIRATHGSLSRPLHHCAYRLPTNSHVCMVVHVRVHDLHIDTLGIPPYVVVRDEQ